MYNNNDEVVGWVGTAIGTISTALQVDQFLHTLQAILTVITLVISLSYTIWKWYKKASKDGKITKDEVDELFDNLKKYNKEDDENGDD